jgi:thioredoxin reductase (NADPH)
MSASSSRPYGEFLGHHRLIVIGAGPVGVAALWFARRSGIDAIAIESGRAPLGTISAFLPGLVTASDATEWEIDGLPVDARDITEITREDLLSYYSRVIALGQLPIACSTRVTALVPSADSINIEVETADGPGHWTAERVIVTPWFRPRPVDFGDAVAVWHPGHDFPDAKDDVVIIGGGLSGFEAADAFIRRGMRVTLLSKDKTSTVHGLTQLFELTQLFKLSGSKVIDNVESVRASRRGLLSVTHDGATTEVRCSAAVNCTGQESNSAVLEILRAADLLSEQEFVSLRQVRRGAFHDPAAIAQSLPNLADALWRGRRGVHFAGTIYNVGGVLGAGIMFSIETAKWAVAAAVGSSSNGPGIEPTAHLPAWFRNHRADPELLKRGPTWSAHLASVIPVPVPSWSRGTRLFAGEDPTASARPISREPRAHGSALEEPLVEVRAACYEGLSVGALFESLKLEQDDFLWVLTVLWYNNGLTWIPPARSAVP